MSIESVATIVGIMSVLTNVVSVVIVLYVKGTIAPLVTELKNHAEQLLHRRRMEEKQWVEITKMKERLAHIEALTNGKGG